MKKKKPTPAKDLDFKKEFIDSVQNGNSIDFVQSNQNLLDLFKKDSVNKDGYPTKVFRNEIEILQIFFDKVCPLFYNEPDRKIYFGYSNSFYLHENSCIELDDMLQNTLFICLKTIYPKQGKKLFEDFIKSKIGKSTSNVFLDFFNKIKDLPFESLGCPIQDLFDCIPNDYSYPELVIQNMGLNISAYDMMFTIFKKWFIGVVRTVYDKKPNMLVPLLVSGVSTKKTSFFENLLGDYHNPKKDLFLKKWLAKIDLKDTNEKDLRAKAAANLLLIADDIPPNGKEAAAFRALISMSTITDRQAYAVYATTTIRYANFCGTTNYFNVITDAKNNRRFIPYAFLEGKSINTDLYNEIDKLALWARAVELYQKMEKLTDCDLTDVEVQFVQNLSLQHTTNQLFPIIKTMLEPSEDGINLFEIYEQFTTKYPSLKNQLNTYKLEEALDSLGYKHKNHVYKLRFT